MLIGGLVALGYGGVTKVAHADGGVNVTTVEGHGTETYTTYTVWYKNSRDESLGGLHDHSQCPASCRHRHHASEPWVFIALVGQLQLTGRNTRGQPQVTSRL